MNNKPIDKSKKVNIKCEHCAYWTCVQRCEISKMATMYWQRCKFFKWAENRKYKC